MARLNDPPSVQSGPLESLDSLKRRFIRQNREIARVNSTQSLRIRNLEAETSRLLSENIALREKVIKLQYEVERTSSRRTIQNVELVKGQLEAKLAELGTLVLGLGNVKSNRRSSISPKKAYVERKSPKRSPDQKNWKNALTLSEVTSGQDGRLPAILEDKLYPRKTLDANELLGIFHDPANTVDSPDFGPPPVAHFEGDGDPIKYDAALNDHEEAIAMKPFTNLETRKKRRESSIGREFARLETLDSIEACTMPVTLENTMGTQPAKLGAKRKLDARDDEDRVVPSAINEKDFFQFNRRSDALDGTGEEIARGALPTGNTIAGNKSSQDRSGVRPLSREKILEGMSLSNTRKALGEKAVNTDPVVSPIRTTKAFTGEKVGDFKKDISRKPRDRDRREKSSAPKIVRLPERRVEPKTAMNEHPPKTTELPPVTPAQPDLNLFSPLSTEPSAPRPESRDTPPPADLHSNTLTNAGRTTRRPRGSVSYTEPNLRDKMRRPTKELVDAVGADERIQRAASVKAENEKGVENGVASERATEKEKIRTVVIKKEDETAWPAAWKSLSAVQMADDNEQPPLASPLGTKSSSSNASSAHLPSTIIASRKRRPSTLPAELSATSPPGNQSRRAPVPAQPSNSGSATTIAALAAIPHRPHPSRSDLITVTRIAEQEPATAHRGRDEASVAQKNNAIDVYDFQGSSPAETIESKNKEAREAPIKEDIPGTDPEAAEATEAGNIRNQDKRIRTSRRYSSVPEALGGKNGGETAAAALTIKGQRGGRRDGVRERETMSVMAGRNPSTGAVEVLTEGRPVSVEEATSRKLEVGRRERAIARRRSGVL